MSAARLLILLCGCLSCRSFLGSESGLCLSRNLGLGRSELACDAGLELLVLCRQGARLSRTGRRPCLARFGGGLRTVGSLTLVGQRDLGAMKVADRCGKVLLARCLCVERGREHSDA